MPSHKEVIGDSKVGVFDSPIDAHAIACEIANIRSFQDNDDSFMIVNLDKLLERFALWKANLPQVEPFYAIKCNPDPVLIRVLASLGAGFDCASKEEIEIVLKSDVEASRIIYANPCKTRGFIKHAEKRNVQMMTFDNAEELEKIASLYKSARIILRIGVSDDTATCPLNVKFGAEPVSTAPALLLKAKQLGVNICGVSFHVGSGCNDSTIYDCAISHARRLFDIGESMGHVMDILDLGGGFPGGHHNPSFEEIAEVISTALCKYFPDPFVRVIAEPGRFFAASPISLCTNVIHATAVSAEKITKNEEDVGKTGMMYYLNDGIYGSFNCIFFDHVHPVGESLFKKEGELMISTLWGPSCDSLDKIEEKWMPKLKVGDWLFYKNMGAYTCASSTTFNGFQKPNMIYVIGQPAWETLSRSM